MKDSVVRGYIVFVMGAFALVVFSACTSQVSQSESSQDTPLAHETEQRDSNEQERVKGISRSTEKTTAENCQIRGGEYMAHEYVLPQDLVDCWLPSSIRRLGPRSTYLGYRRILASVYDYLYRRGTEKPNYGLYSYVLFSNHSPRNNHFLEGLFQTTSVVDLSSIDFGNINLIYLPIRQDMLSSILPMIYDYSAPPVNLFTTRFYDYGLAQELLAQICTEPAKVIRDVCATDLSRGPYLFTYKHPMSTLSPVPPPYLFVDLSYVHERAFGEFIAAYKEQVKRTDYTDLQRIDNLRIRLLNILLMAADWIDPIKKSMASIIHLAEREGNGGQ